MPDNSSPAKPVSVWSGVLRALGIAGAGLASVAAPASAQPPTAIPQHWLSYAQLVSHQFQAWLSDPADDAVQRLHAWMQERLLREDQPLPLPPLVVAVWIDADGRVERLDFVSLGSAQADADLRTVLRARALSEPPPPDMRQPMMLQLELEFLGPGI